MRVFGLFRLPCFALLFVAVFLSSCADATKQAARELRDRGYELTERDYLMAAGAGDLDGLELFARGGMEVDATDEGGNTALIRAASGGHLEAVELLLGMGADPRHLNSDGRDALIASSAKGFVEIARMLLGRGADFNARDTEGWSALSIAAYNGHEDLVTLLGASVLSKDLDEALLVASFNGDQRVISALLSQGADINSRSPEGKTPLMIAAEAGKPQAVRILLQHQANPYAEVEEGVTAGVLAARAGHEEIQRLIADPDSWGSSETSERIVAEKSEAQKALLTSMAVEETIAPPTAEIASAASAEPSPATETAPGTRSEPASETPLVAAAAPEGEDRKRGGAAPASGPSESESASLADAVPTERSSQAGSAEAPVAASGIVASASPVASAGPADTASASAAAGRPEARRPAAPRAPAAERALTPEQRARLREEAATKPVVAMNGSTIRSTSPAVAPVRSMVLASFHEEPIPIRVTQVETDRAEVRRIDRPEAPPVAAVPGELIEGTSYEVLGVERRFVSSKEGQGRMVDVSRVKVHNRETGGTHLLVKDVAGQSSDTYAIITAPGSQYRYAVKSGDVFRSAQPGIGEREYQVLDIRASGVVVKDLMTAEVLTIARDGVE